MKKNKRLWTDLRGSIPSVGVPISNIMYDMKIRGVYTPDFSFNEKTFKVRQVSRFKGRKTNLDMVFNREVLNASKAEVTLKGNFIFKGKMNIPYEVQFEVAMEVPNKFIDFPYHRNYLWTYLRYILLSSSTLFKLYPDGFVITRYLFYEDIKYGPVIKYLDELEREDD